MDWNKLKIHPSSTTTDSDIKDFIKWVSRKAERLGFRVELDLFRESQSSSAEAISVNPLVNNDEKH